MPNKTPSYKDKVIEKLRELLVGIDKTSIEDQGVEGWWETSTGADFGFNKLIEIEALISQALEEQMKLVMECLDHENLPIAPIVWTDEQSEAYRMAIMDFKSSLKSKGLI